MLSVLPTNIQKLRAVGDTHLPLKQLVVSLWSGDVDK